MQKVRQKTSSRSLFFLKKKSLIRGKGKWYVAWLQNISIVLDLAYNKNKLRKTLKTFDPDFNFS